MFAFEGACMNWNLAVEKNQEALKRILVMLVAMVAMTSAGHAVPKDGHPATLPRHLHRFVLRLLRPAEAAMRRLIIIAARGIAVKLPKFREAKPRPKKPPLNRKNGYGTNIVIRPGPLPEWAKALVPKRSPRLSLPLLDPMKRFGVRRKYAKPGAMPRIRVLGGDGWSAPFFRQPEPLPPPPPTPDDPLDAGNIHRRLDVLAAALDDLPRQALRMARWQARRDARLERERENNRSATFSLAPPSVLPDISPTRGEISSGALGSSPSPLATGEAGDASVISPRVGEMSGRTEGGAKERDVREAALIDLGVTPEAIALIRRPRLQGRPGQTSVSAQPAKPRRFQRISPMRPGRPPGWRKRQNHEVYEVLNELHGLAVWASERPNTS
jgi:hypothetical protein